MRAPSWRLRVVVDNAAICLLTAALATGVRPEWLWWPVNSPAFLWMTFAMSAFVVATSGLLWIAGDKE